MLQAMLDADVHLGSMKHTGERVVAGRTTGIFELGDTVTWQARHLGITQRLRVQITALDFPAYFRDEMISGAFKAMRHDHCFFALPEDGTRMTDAFCYETPLGLLGRLADRIFLRRYMRRLLLRRNAFIKAQAEKAAAQ